MKNLWHWIVGKPCRAHDLRYRSDFCGRCIKTLVLRSETLDTRPEWTRAEGLWPLKGGTSE